MIIYKNQECVGNCSGLLLAATGTGADRDLARTSRAAANGTTAHQTPDTALSARIDSRTDDTTHAALARVHGRTQRRDREVKEKERTVEQRVHQTGGSRRAERRAKRVVIDWRRCRYC